METVYTRTFTHASRVLGGDNELAAFLGVELVQVSAWLNGAAVPPMEPFLTAVDLLNACFSLREAEVREVLSDCLKRASNAA